MITRIVFFGIAAAMIALVIYSAVTA